MNPTVFGNNQCIEVNEYFTISVFRFLLNETFQRHGKNLKMESAPLPLILNRPIFETPLLQWFGVKFGYKLQKEINFKITQNH